MHKSFAGPRIKLWINQKQWTILAAPLLTFSAFGAFVVLGWRFSQQRIVRSLQETFPDTVTFQNFRQTYFPHPGCVAEGVSFRRLGSFCANTADRDHPKIENTNPLSESSVPARIFGAHYDREDFWYRCPRSEPKCSKQAGVKCHHPEWVKSFSMARWLRLLALTPRPLCGSIFINCD